MAGISLGTNLPALQTNRRLGETAAKLQRSFARLSSGLRINRSVDDAAGLSIAESLRTDSRVYTQGVRNLNDGVSITNIADSTLNELTNIVTRLEELAEQAANGTLGVKQRASLDAEAQALAKEYFRISRVTTFNGLNLFNGSTQALRFQAGYGTNGAVAGTIGGALGTGAFAAAVASGHAGYDFQALAFADLNGDGILDMAAAGDNGVPGVAVIKLGLGDGTFGAVISYGAETGSTYALTLGDLNSDGIVDLITAGQTAGGAGSATIRLGNGNGTFGAAASFSTESTQSNAVNLGDLNGDGIPDLMTAGVGAGTGRVTVRLGTGTGSFGAATSYAAENSWSSSIRLGDLNRDGIPDLVSAGNGGMDLTVTARLGNGDGFFRTAISFADGNIINAGADHALADFNGDGFLDFVALGEAPFATMLVAFGNGNGTFGTSVSYVMNSEDGTGLAVGDFNGDGLLDVATSGYGLVQGEYGGTIAIRLGNGNGSFASCTEYKTSPGTPSDLALGDLNGDGVLEIATAANGGNLTFHYQTTEAGVSPLLPFSLATKADALQALPMLKQALSRVSSQRGSIGALQSRLTTALSTLQAAKENFESARSSITDVDVAEESAALVRSSILQQAAVTILTQANQAPALAVKLLSD